MKDYTLNLTPLFPRPEQHQYKLVWATCKANRAVSKSHMCIHPWWAGRPACGGCLGARLPSCCALDGQLSVCTSIRSSPLVSILYWSPFSSPFYSFKLNVLALVRNNSEITIRAAEAERPIFVPWRRLSSPSCKSKEEMGAVMVAADGGCSRKRQWMWVWGCRKEEEEGKKHEIRHERWRETCWHGPGEGAGMKELGSCCCLQLLRAAVAAIASLLPFPKLIAS